MSPLIIIGTGLIIIIVGAIVIYILVCIYSHTCKQKKSVEGS